MTKKPGRPQRTQVKIGFFHMVRDVLIASINKGQFPLGLFGIIMIIMALRLPAEDISKLAWAIFDALSKGQIVGNVLFVIACGGWMIHTKLQRRSITGEMKRISEERNRLQKDLGLKIGSSEEDKK